MVNSLAEFFGIIGYADAVPLTLSEFFPWLLKIFLAIAIIAYILKFFAAFANGIFHAGRWMR